MPQRRVLLDNYAYHTVSVTRDRRPLLTLRGVPDVLLRAIDYERNALHASVLAYAILPDHMHLLVVPTEPFDVSKVMHSLKSFSAKAINQTLNRNGSVWQASFYDRVIRDHEHLLRTVEYIHHNPVAAGLVSHAEEYAWCSAYPSSVTDGESFFG